MNLQKIDIFCASPGKFSASARICEAAGLPEEKLPFAIKRRLLCDRDVQNRRLVVIIFPQGGYAGSDLEQ